MPSGWSRSSQPTGRARNRSRIGAASSVVLQSEVGDLILSHQVTQSVLQLRLLNEEIVFRLESGRCHRTLVVEGEPFLDSLHPRALREIGEQRQVKDDRRGENRVAAEEVDLDLHR